MMRVDLNCDMGEGIGNDSAIMPFISSANIACGFHAGDYDTIVTTVQEALKHGVAVGAHPSYPDRQNFGRSQMTLSPRSIHAMILYQLGAVDAIVRNLGGKLHHVKPHGALYNMAAVNRELSDSIVAAIMDFNDDLILYGLSNSVMIASAKTAGIKFKQEAFADRTYQDDGTLTPRKQSSALITDVGQCVKQVLSMIKEKSIVSLSGKRISLEADTICLHGDGEHAVHFAQLLNGKIRKDGIQITAK